MILVASSLSLLVIAVGMFLYAKTLKENLSRFFKIVALFIVIVGFLNLFVGSAIFMVKKIYMFGAHHHNMGQGGYGHHEKKMKKHGAKYRSCGGECQYGGKGGHCGKMKMACGQDCCPSMMGKKDIDHGSACVRKSMIIKKDTIVVDK